jgi:tetratricopeptide (TPR) repeat protein
VHRRIPDGSGLPDPERDWKETALNPVEKRLSDLRASWLDFRAHDSARLLIWRVPDDAGRLVQCFFEIQKHDTELATGDRFVVLEAPFAHSIQYSRVLLEAIAGKPPDGPLSATAVVEALGLLEGAGTERHGCLAAVLMPASIGHDAAFSGWLRRALAAGVPDRVRVAVIDSVETPRLLELSAGGAGIHVESPRIDALAMARETFAGEGAVGPAAVFRNHLMDLVTLIQKGSPEQASRKADDALAFARKAQWIDQEVVVSMLLSGAFLKSQRFDDAVATYGKAREGARRATEIGHPSGRQLLVQAEFGEAGVHLAAGHPARAAECYGRALVAARQIPDNTLAIEAMRMGSFCHARMNDRQGAIAHAEAALALGETLPPSERAMSTLPMAIGDLLRSMSPDRMRMLDAIGQRRGKRIEQARRSVEARAVELEGTTDPAEFHAAEARFEAERAAAAGAAGDELQSFASGGSDAFRRTFAKAKTLLGDAWPIAAAAAGGASG